MVGCINKTGELKQQFVKKEIRSRHFSPFQNTLGYWSLTVVPTFC